MRKLLCALAALLLIFETSAAQERYLPSECDEEGAKYELLYNGHSIQEAPPFSSQDEYAAGAGAPALKQRDYHFIADDVIALFDKAVPDIGAQERVREQLGLKMYAVKQAYVENPTVQTIYRGARSAAGCLGNVAICVTRSCASDPDGKECRTIELMSTKLKLRERTQEQVKALRTVLRQLKKHSGSPAVRRKIAALEKRVSVMQSFQSAFQAKWPAEAGFAWHCYDKLREKPTPTPTAAPTATSAPAATPAASPRIGILTSVTSYYMLSAN